MSSLISEASFLRSDTLLNLVILSNRHGQIRWYPPAVSVRLPMPNERPIQYKHDQLIHKATRLALVRLLAQSFVTFPDEQFRVGGWKSHQYPALKTVEYYFSAGR